MQKPVFLRPVFQEKIWGGSHLRSVFGFDIPNNKIGEDQTISTHPHGASVVENGEFKRKRLDELQSKHRELFGHPLEPVFPLSIKILDAEGDLSMQVHPGDAYGMKHEGELGKTECWYIIDAGPGIEIIYGHHARTREELAEMVRDGHWGDLPKKVPVKKGDFFYVLSGTIHVIGRGIMVLEAQQSSDVTYRVYDHDRKDTQGQTRELYIQQSIGITTVPVKAPELQIKEVRKGNSSTVAYLETEFSDVYEWDIKGITSFKKQAPYTLATVIEGTGDLVVDGRTYLLEGGTSCIIPDSASEWVVQGEPAIIAFELGKQLPDS